SERPRRCRRAWPRPCGWVHHPPVRDAYGPGPGSSHQLQAVGLDHGELAQLLDDIALVAAVVVLNAGPPRVLEQVAAPGTVLVVQRQVVPAGHHHALGREERHGERRETTVGGNHLLLLDALLLGRSAGLV